MKRGRPDMFGTRYDWDDGTWRAEVRDMNGGLIAYRRYKTEKGADRGVEDIRSRLAGAPHGNAMGVLAAWASWVLPGLAKEGEARWRRER